MHPYLPATPEDIKEMLESIGLESLDQLFDAIPKDVYFGKELDMPKAKSELEVTTYLKGLADKNCSLSKLTSFLGAGAYDHYIPSIVDHIISRSEFYTSYTPYQPEISQGTLQYIFEFQTLIANLTGMDAANASSFSNSSPTSGSSTYTISPS